MTTKTTKRLGNIKDDLPRQQFGIGSFKAVAAIAGIGVTFILIFLFANGTGSPKVTTGDTKADAPVTPSSPPTSQPNVIRIPDSYSAYVNKQYKFSFAHPAPWANSIVVKGPNDTSSAPSPTQLSFFTNYPLGGSVLNGQLSVYVDKHDAFKMFFRSNGATIAPVKLGDGYGWKVVQASATSPTLKVGDSYNVKSATYQSGVPVYNFVDSTSTIIQSRWVFQSGDNFVSISLPPLSHADGSAPNTADIALYTAISNNVAKTARPTN